MGPSGPSSSSNASLNIRFQCPKGGFVAVDRELKNLK